MNRHLMAFLLLLAALSGAAWLLFGTPADPDHADSTSTIEQEEADGPLAEVSGADLQQPGAADDEELSGTAERQATKDNRITVRGRLVTAGTKPLRDIDVQLLPGGGPFVYFMPQLIGTIKGAQKARTGERGEFEFRIPAARAGSIGVVGEDWVLAKRVGFTAATADVQLGDIECIRAARIAGRVHEAGRGLAKVQVHVYAHGARYFSSSTKTDAKGRFEVAGIRPGKCNIMCSSGRHLSKQQELVLEPGEERITMAIELQPGSSIAGQVLDDIGRPLAGIDVRAHGSRLDTADGKQFTAGRAKSDESGFFTLGGVAGEKVNIQASGKGVVSHWKNNVPVDGGLLVIRMTRLGSLSGTLLSETGTPIEGSTVVASPERSGTANTRIAVFESYSIPARHRSGKRAKTDAKGRFEIAGIKPGKMLVVATGEHAETKQSGVIVRPGAETKDVLLRAARGVVVEVTVRDPDGKPVAGATVSAKTKPKATKRSVPFGTEARVMLEYARANAALRARSRASRSVKTDEEGVARLYGLRAGEVEITAKEPRWVSAKKTATLPASGEHAVDLSLGRGGFVEVLTVDDRSKPLGGLSFRVRPEAKGGRSKSGKTDAAGRARVGPFPPGEYTVSLRRGGSTVGAFAGEVHFLMPAPSGVSGRGDLGAKVPVRVREGETSEVTLVKPILTVLGGTVRDANGAVRGAAITIQRVRVPGEKDFSAHRSRATSGADGTFNFRDLVAGQWLLEFRRKSSGIAFTQVIEIRPGERLRSVDLLLAGHALTVAVSAEGGGVGGATVRVRRKPQPGSRGRPSLVAMSKPTGADGSVEFGELPDGVYEVSVTHERFAPHTVADVRVSGPLRLPVELTGGGTLAVTLDTGDAQPASQIFVLYRLKGTKRWRSSRSSKGVCKIQRLQPGEYELRAMGRPRPGAVRSAPQWGPTVTVVVRSGVTEKVVLPAQ